MPRKKRTSRSAGSSSQVQKKMNLAWKNFVLFIMLFILSFLLYNFSSNNLLINFFGVISIILGFLAFAFLIVLVVFFLVKKRR